MQAIIEWSVPSKVTKLRSFLGLANYYRWLIKGYSKIMNPLTDLLKNAELWYDIHEKEMATVVHCPDAWGHYLLGTKFAVVMNNVDNTYFRTQRKLSLKQTRW